MKKFKQWMKQRKFTKYHREVEDSSGPRLSTLSDYPAPSYGGKRPWCDAILQNCFYPGHDQCCYCTHTEQNPWAGDDRG